MVKDVGSDRRVMVKGSPFNCEAAVASLDSFITPIEDFYVRSNFPTPPIDHAQWRLAVGGLVARPLNLSLTELQALPSRTVSVTLECAGNNRTLMAPIPEGEAWERGAVSTGTFTGVSLATVLEQAGLASGAVEIRFEGADRGVPRGRTETINFERSLPLHVAMLPDVLLCYAMNGRPLTDEHGAPVRVVVPGWYGMAAVKWLQRIEVLDHPFEGHYQTRQYVYERPGVSDRPPVRAIRIKSMIIDPLPDSRIAPGAFEVRGVAWCGDAAVSRVEVSVDAGAWQEAELLDQPVPYTWRQWRWQWSGAPIGRHSLRVRATDERGNQQPDQPDWNRLGYGNNAVQVTLTKVVDER